MALVSFDIDGTLETGDPPGPVTLGIVRLAQERGHVVGSASDRTVAFQRGMWTEHAIDVDFIGHKHHLSELIKPFDCERLIHIGDTDVDRHYALLAGFEFVHVSEVPATGSEGWIL